MQYFRVVSEVCAEGSVNVWHWVRYVDGEWRAVNRETSEHRLHTRMRATILSEHNALWWFLSNPVKLILAEKAGKQDSVWDDVAEQEVFADIARCFYCGVNMWEGPVR